MNSVLESLPENERKNLKKASMPDFVKPMLAKLSHDRFYNDEWIYERKLDGERCLAFKKKSSVTLKSRNNKKINVSYPEIERACLRISAHDVILDGEIVAFEGNVTSFARLQNRMHVQNKKKAEQSGVSVYYYVFDIVHVDGFDLSKLPLLSRKHVLRQLIEYENPLRFTTHRVNDTRKYYRQACRKGWEGLIVKKKDSTYVHTRSSEWKKFKCTNEQEFVIGGYTDPQGSRIGFGALLLGYYKGGVLRYAGKVGTGFSDETLKHLKKKFSKKQTDTSPFLKKICEKKTHWLKPVLVCEVGFTEWTSDNKLRHPRFLGLRRDKSPKDVHKESSYA